MALLGFYGGDVVRQFVSAGINPDARKDCFYCDERYH